MPSRGAGRVEVVVINWKRPDNVAEIVEALRRQTYACTVTICDCHEAPEFELPRQALAAADRVYRWRHNLGSFNRYVPMGAYDHKYTFFIDDDMLPGIRCVEHFVKSAEELRAFGALGQVGRIVRADGTYQPSNVLRSAGFTEVDFLVRAFFVRTSSLSQMHQMRGLLDGSSDPEDDILLAVGLALHGGMRCYLTPIDTDAQTLVNMRDLSNAHARAGRPDHFQLRTRMLQRAMAIGWQPLRCRQAGLLAEQEKPDASAEARGVLLLAVGERYRALAKGSVVSLRRYGYDGPVRLVTDEPGWIPPELRCETVVVPAVSDGFAARHYKTQLYKYAYEQTLFIDADAVAIADIEPVWNYLDNYDLAVAADLRSTVAELIARDLGSADLRPEFSFMVRLGHTNRTIFNSGVMLFRRSPVVEALFESWHIEWQRFRHRDQLALVRALALTAPAVRVLPAHWNCRPSGFTSIRDAQKAGVKILHFWSATRGFMTNELASTLSNVRDYPRGGGWEEQPLRQFGRHTQENCGRPDHVGRVGGFLAATHAGGDERFEMVIPAAEGVDNYWRPQRAAPDSWSEPVTVGREWGKAEAACITQDSAARDGNLELMIRAGSRLAHYSRRPFPNWQWEETSWLPDGVTGNPSLVHSGGAASGKLELIVPLLSGGVAHYRGSAVGAARHWTGVGVFGRDIGQVEAVALVLDHLSSPTGLDAVVRVGEELLHYRCLLDGERGWRGPEHVFSGAAGVPGMVQRQCSSPGNLELLTPLAIGGMVHLWRGGNSPSWQRTMFVDPGSESVDAVSLLESCSQASPVDLEAVVTTDAEVRWYSRLGGPFGSWSSITL